METAKDFQKEIERLELEIQRLEEELESGEDSREIDQVEVITTICPNCRRIGELDSNGVCYQC